MSSNKKQEFLTSGRNIVLAGFMGTGKTSTGKILAKKLKMDFLDTDAVIQDTTGIVISEIFEKQGEVAFREIEKRVVLNAATRISTVIAVGGGAIVDPENLSYLRKSGVVICLEASPEVIYQRTCLNNERPLLNTDKRLEKIRVLLGKRKQSYEKADFRIVTDAKTPEMVAKEIIELLDNR